MTRTVGHTSPTCHVSKSASSDHPQKKPYLFTSPCLFSQPTLSTITPVFKFQPIGLRSKIEFCSIFRDPVTVPRIGSSVNSSMAASAVSIGGGSLFGKVPSARMNKNKNKNMSRTRVMCVSSRTSNLAEQYKTLKIQPGSSEMEVKKAFRQLALQYHPDVCNGKYSGVHFSRINEAYHVVMKNLRDDSPEVVVEEYDEEEEVDDELWYDESNWELWNEYSTQFNNYNI